MNQNNALPKPKRKFEAGNNKEHKIEIIIDSIIYNKEAEN